MFAALSRSTLASTSRHVSLRTISSTSSTFAKANKPQNISGEPPTPPNVSETVPEPPSSPFPEPTNARIVSLDFSPEDAERPITGARSARQSGGMTSAEKQRRQSTRNMLLFLGLGAIAHVVWMGGDWEEDELRKHKWTQETSPQGRYERTKARYKGIFGYFADPISTDLLPPPFPPPDNRPYVLVVSLDDLLIHSSWDRQHGWRTAKRPGVDYFLAYLSQFFEIVVFTDQNSYTAEPIIQQLDKFGFFIPHRLYRESTRAINGLIAKDLSYLNRDISKVVVLDTNASHIRTHPENAIILPRWEGDKQGARGLVDMIPFLEHIAFFNYPDVRPVLQNWKDKNIPVEYAKWEAEYKQRHLEALAAKGGVKAVGGTFSLGSLFSSQRHPTVPTSSGKVDPRTLSFIELKRMQAQHRFLDEQRQLEKNKDLLEKIYQEQQDAAAAGIPNNLWEMLDQMAGNPKQLPPPNETSSASGEVKRT
ncbi:import inner membrane translocase subunit tim-50 [Flagelloscypha sp. PMI_526]|nr:import inner membrane translocase subunit tim-50 [Flagelloscypha sp. PMI_526]